MIPIDKYQDDDTLVVRVELAGIDPEVDVECGQSAGFDRAAPTRDCAGRGRAGGRETLSGALDPGPENRRPVVVITIIPQVRGVTSRRSRPHRDVAESPLHVIRKPAAPEHVP
jgi:hypothetical protein